MKLQLPEIIFLIGLPCSGKSTFRKTILDNHPSYSPIDDFLALKEIAEFDNFIFGLQNKDYDDNKALDLFQKEKEQLTYANEIGEEYLALIKLGKLKSVKPYSIINADGSIDVLRPQIWDKILKFSISNANSAKLVFEFARGRDEEYLKLYNIKEEEVYQQSFSNIINSIDEASRNKCLIYHFQAELANRLKRNEKRREEGGHYISPITMNSDYKKDKSIALYNPDKDGRAFLQTSETSIPVLLVDNNEYHDDLESHFKFILDTGFLFFQQNISK